VAFVLRGGSWNNTPENVRAAYRNRNDPTKRNNNNGFRLVLPQDSRILPSVRFLRKLNRRVIIHGLLSRAGVLTPDE
jgi:hypothetical protein